MSRGILKFLCVFFLKIHTGIDAKVVGRCKMSHLGNFVSELSEFPKYRHPRRIGICKQDPVKTLIFLKRIGWINDTPARIFPKIKRWCGGDSRLSGICFGEIEEICVMTVKRLFATQKTVHGGGVGAVEIACNHTIIRLYGRDCIDRGDGGLLPQKCTLPR